MSHRLRRRVAPDRPAFRGQARQTETSNSLHFGAATMGFRGVSQASAPLDSHRAGLGGLRGLHPVPSSPMSGRTLALVS